MTMVQMVHGIFSQILLVQLVNSDIAQILLLRGTVGTASFFSSHVNLSDNVCVPTAVSHLGKWGRKRGGCLVTLSPLPAFTPAVPHPTGHMPYL